MNLAVTAQQREDDHHRNHREDRSDHIKEDAGAVHVVAGHLDQGAHCPVALLLEGIDVGESIDDYVQPKRADAQDRKCVPEPRQ